MLRIVSIILIATFIGSIVNGQSKTFDKKVYAKQLADSLKVSGLTFIVPTLQKKMQALDSLWRETSDSSWLRQRIETENYALRQAKMWKDAFAKHYSFSSISFLEDSNMQPSVLRKRSYYVRVGQLESGADALIISNQRFESLMRPFPYFSRLEPFMAWFGGKSELKMAEKAVERLQNKLQKFSS